MQNKQAIIGIIAAAIILVGAGGAFLYSKNNPKPNQPNTATEVKNENTSESAMEGDILDLLKSGKNQKCTINFSDENGSTKGSFYLSNESMRADLEITTTDNKTTQMNMIRKNDDNYIWGGGFPAGTGLKMTLSAEEYMNDAETKKYFDPTKKADYNCDDWIVDSTVFTPPSNIKFSDLSEMMQGVIDKETKPSGTSTTNCSICSSLSGEAKNTCLSSLNCQ